VPGNLFWFCIHIPAAAPTRAALRYCSNRVLKEFYEILRDAFPPIEKEEIDPKNLIAFQDCIFDLDQQKILSLTPNIYITQNVDYALNSSTNQFQETRQFLFDLAEGYEDRIEYLEAIIAYVVFRMKGKQCLFHLYGKGGTGKTTLTNYLSSLVGLHEVTTTTPKKIGAERFEAATFKDKNLVLISDRKGDSNVNFFLFCNGEGSNIEKIKKFPGF
jgi:phage/plasmid-associated DNA primase